VVDGVLQAPRLLRLGHRPTSCDGLVVERQAVGVDGRAVGGPADVVPDRGPIGAGGSRIDVVAEELRGQVVLAAAPGIAPGLRWTSLKAPTVPAATSACLTTPTRFLAEVVSLRNGVVKALYTTQTSVPLGEIAAAA